MTTIHRILKSATMGVFALVIAAAPAAAQDFKVVVNSSNSTSELSSDMATKLFLKQSTKFPNGTAAQPVDLAKASAVRAAFSKSVLGRPVGAIELLGQGRTAGREVERRRRDCLREGEPGGNRVRQRRRCHRRRESD